MNIHLIAIIVAAVASFIIGFLFHGPLFGKLWMRLSNIQPTGNEKMSDMYGQMVWNLVVNLVTGFGLALLYVIASTSSLFSVTGASLGVSMALIVWAGFLVPSSAIDVIWMGKSWKLWLFEAGSSLVAMIAMGLAIGLL